MALYAIGDTHLSEGVNKPMDIFGGAWQDYRNKLVSNLEKTLKSEDTLLICGDFSWGMSLKEALPDFQLIASFPGKKIILKGNHDYWWETVSKMQKYLQLNHINDLQFLHNNCIFYSGIAICGTRGWFLDPEDPESADEKIFRREVIRLETSLKQAKSENKGSEIYVFLHYPPIFAGREISQITELLHKYGVSRCYYGHIHGESLGYAFNGTYDGVRYTNISADGLGFRPILICE